MVKINLAGEEGGLDVESKHFKRVRHATDSERSAHPQMATRLDYLNTLYAKELADKVIAAISGLDAEEAKLFGKLTLPNSQPVWFRGPGNAVGPIAIPPSLRDDNIKSALRIGGKLQFVRETPEQVEAIIKAVKGEAVPPIAFESPPAEVGTLERSLSDDEVWDFEVPELKVEPGTSDR